MFYIAQVEHTSVEEIYADNIREAEEIALRDYSYGVVFETETEAYDYIEGV